MSVILCVVVLFLTIASVVGDYYKLFGGSDPFLLKVVDKIDLDLESNNLPTWYQSSTLLLCSFLMTIIAFVRHELKDKASRYWSLLALIFLYLSVDEAVAIHEQISVPLRQAFELHGLFFFSWVIPASILVLILFVVFLKFLWQLPMQIRRLFFIAGCIYLTGALGMEMVGAKYYETYIETQNGVVNSTYIWLTTFEELFEMAGMIVFIYALLTYLGSEALHIFASETEKSAETLETKVAISETVVARLNTK